MRQMRQKDGSTRLDIQCQIQSTAAGAAGTLSAALPALNATASCAVELPAAGVQTTVIQVGCQQNPLRYAPLLASACFCPTVAPLLLPTIDPQCNVIMAVTAVHAAQSKDHLRTLLLSPAAARVRQRLP